MRSLRSGASRTDSGFSTASRQGLTGSDGGRGFRRGQWADLNKFKSPSLRGLSSRGGYFHNGIAKTLMDVVLFYEQARGFSFTPEERDDLVTFMGCL
jgi:cytochrome c peroxidase